MKKLRETPTRQRTQLAKTATSWTTGQRCQTCFALFPKLCPINGKCSCSCQGFQQSPSICFHSIRASAFASLCPDPLLSLSRRLCCPMPLGLETMAGNTMPTIAFDICVPTLHGDAPSNRAIFSTFWGDFLAKLHRKPGEKGKEPKTQKKKIQWRRCPEIADFCPFSWSNAS